MSHKPLALKALRLNTQLAGEPALPQVLPIPVNSVATQDARAPELEEA